MTKRTEIKRIFLKGLAAPADGDGAQRLLELAKRAGIPVEVRGTWRLLSPGSLAGTSVVHDFGALPDKLDPEDVLIDATLDGRAVGSTFADIEIQMLYQYVAKLEERQMYAKFKEGDEVLLRRELRAVGLQKGTQGRVVERGSDYVRVSFSNSTVIDGVFDLFEKVEVSPPEPIYADLARFAQVPSDPLHPEPLVESEHKPITVSPDGHTVTADPSALPTAAQVQQALDQHKNVQRFSKGQAVRALRDVGNVKAGEVVFFIEPQNAVLTNGCDVQVCRPDTVFTCPFPLDALEDAYPIRVGDRVYSNQEAPAGWWAVVQRIVDYHYTTVRDMNGVLMEEKLSDLSLSPPS